MNKYDSRVQNQPKEKKAKDYKTYTDYDIFPGKVRLIIEGQSPRIIDRDQAISMAKSENKNLIQIAYNKNEFPHSVCKIIDYGKFKYEQQKREKEAKKAARAATADIKEIGFTIRIDDGDKNTKINHIKEFLEEKNKVKIIVKLSRREMNLVGMAKDLMKEILNSLNGLAELDSNPSFNGGILSCIIRPSK